MSNIRLQSFVQVAVLASTVLLAGCFNYLAPFGVTKEAHPGLQSAQYSELKRLPPPQEKIVAAVYRFRDQTGQYKASDNMASWSTAVTQGATSILMRALEESGWFIPIEREGLSNLLNERQIIQSIRAQHTGPDGEPLGPLPPLLYAGVLIEGGIIGYDTNVMTGGLGARYFGTGGAGQYRQDQVTVYVRVVSTQNGRVLKTVHTTKTIVSQKLDGGVFRYVDVKRILEGETGYSLNEPPVLAVTEAIEEAVKNLIIEGVRENLWALQNPNDIYSDVFLAYDQSLERANQLDYYDRLPQDNRPGLGLGFSAGALRYQGNYLNPLARPTAELFVRGNLSHHFALGAGFSFGELAAEGAFSKTHIAGDAHLIYYMVPLGAVTPFVSGGLGLLVQSDSEISGGLFPYVSGAVGVELMPSRRFGVSLSFGNNYPLVEGLDGLKMGSINDNVWSLKTGITYYMF